MKLKMHACGDKSLPQTERIYFQVFLPKGNKEKSKPMFFCSKWSIGKVVDVAASLASLENNNNKSTAQKLRLCHTASGQALPFEHTLETWLSDKEYPLYNGGNIILEYLDNDAQVQPREHRGGCGVNRFSGACARKAARPSESGESSGGDSGGKRQRLHI
ncbi:AN1-type zinc finger protein 1 [Patagioenas fasciata monilis]|uniref:AN1-type zinc finger protein 1 n=1 Tax=Patagioenas fasciata monilis TaxID=372326 RepID=A0A1V4KGT0_PATFA|nr:AN1-type zinc finger protein 1 [Patagioenas fasciata monilis]